MTFEDVKKYIDTVKDDERFKELIAFTKMTEIQPNKDFYENIEYYLKLYCAKRDVKNRYSFQPDYEYFINFVEQYLKNEPAEIVIDNKGYIDLNKTLHMVRPYRFCGLGNFIDNHIIFTDGSTYISKMPLVYKGNSGIRDGSCLYSTLIASNIAKHFGVEVAKVRLAINYNGNKILSKNFLSTGEEIVTYIEETEDPIISNYLEKMERALTLRKYPKNEIEKVKFDFLKQEFLAKLIGLKDQSVDNSPFIISTDNEGNRHVRMAPMFDLDYSFHIGEKIKDMKVRKCDNGKTDIGSLIEQYKDYPGFKEFVISGINSFDVRKTFGKIAKETGIKAFDGYEENEEIMNFVNFVERNLELAKATITSVYEKEGEDR